MDIKNMVIKRLPSFFMVFILLGSVLGASLRAETSTAYGGDSYIVQAVDSAAAARQVSRCGGVVTSRLGVIHAVGARLTSSAISCLASSQLITQITPNALFQKADVGLLDLNGSNRPVTDYPNVVGADTVWAQGVTGAGVTVAVVDTGLNNQKGIRSKIIAWADFVDRSQARTDPNGHGSHLAGIIASDEKGTDGEWLGVAPGVNLVSVRVLNREGVGSYESVIEGIQWVIDHKDAYNIRVMNLSIVAPVNSPYWADPVNQAVMEAWAAGITVVTAAGNQGPDPMTISVPGNTPYVITVGAFTDNFTPLDWSDDYIAPFSAAGPTNDRFIKPDVVAPGAHMVASMSPGSYIALNHEANWVWNQYFSMAGTSQAAAVVSGVAALVISQNPDLTPDEVKYRLMASAFTWRDIETGEAVYSMWQQGSGRVNAPDAVFGDLTGSANLGMDINADLTGTQHYEGYSDFDAADGYFKLRNVLEIEDSSYGMWAGNYDTWTGSYGMWAGSYGMWAGSYGMWAGSYGMWAGSYGMWAGSYGMWAGSYGMWAGSYGMWAGSYGMWAGSYGMWAGSYTQDTSNRTTPGFASPINGPGGGPSLNAWVEEP